MRDDDKVMMMMMMMICMCSKYHRSSQLNLPPAFVVPGNAIPMAPSQASCLPCHAGTMRPRACRRPRSFGETYAKSGCIVFLGGLRWCKCRVP